MRWPSWIIVDHYSHRMSVELALATNHPRKEYIATTRCYSMSSNPRTLPTSLVSTSSVRIRIQIHLQVQAAINEFVLYCDDMWMLCNVYYPFYCNNNTGMYGFYFNFSYSWWPSDNKCTNWFMFLLFHVPRTQQNTYSVLSFHLIRPCPWI